MEGAASFPTVMQAKSKHRRKIMQCALINHPFEVGAVFILEQWYRLFVRALSQRILVKVYVGNLYKRVSLREVYSERIIDVKRGGQPATIGVEMRRTIIAKMEDGLCIGGKLCRDDLPSLTNCLHRSGGRHRWRWAHAGHTNTRRGVDDRNRISDPGCGRLMQLESSRLTLV